MTDIDGNGFGIDVKKTLLDLKITQRELAKELGITSAYLSDILQGKRIAHDKRLEIKKLLEVYVRKGI